MDAVPARSGGQCPRRALSALVKDPDPWSSSSDGGQGSGPLSLDEGSTARTRRGERPTTQEVAEMNRQYKSENRRLPSAGLPISASKEAHNLTPIIAGDLRAVKSDSVVFARSFGFSGQNQYTETRNSETTTKNSKVLE